MTALEHIYNRLPTKPTKDNMFSVRIDDNLHKRVLAYATAMHECRARAFVQLAEFGLQAWAEQHNITLNDRAIEEFLSSQGLIESNNNQ